jgi:hypothetical protein
VFKGKAALSISPILPVFSKLEVCLLICLCSTSRLLGLDALLAVYIIFLFYQSGGSRVNRNGSVMLTFFPAVGQRKYDYAKKQVKLLCISYF